MILQMLVINAASAAICFSVLWLIALRIRDVSFIDCWWALGMVVLAWSSFLATGAALTPQRLALLALTTFWGLRLGIYLLRRWRRHGPDRRYQSMFARAQAKRGVSFAWWALTTVFGLQAALQFIVALPAQLGQISEGGLEPLGWAGIALAIIGIAFESIADLQLARFKADPKNRERVLDTGLWRYTRHPNYFGDCCTWWGLFLIAAQSPVGLWALPGPILLTVLLTRWSGVPTVEGHMRRNRPGYEDYIRRTSGFLPWFPKRQ